MNFVLVVVTYLAGSTWGPTVTMQEFKSQSSCLEAEATIQNMVREMNKTNILGGVPRRDIIMTKCTAQ